jgi:hypothetical protein
MSRLDELPPDQRAALSLVLLQKKSYAEVAAMLRIGEQAVHDRAHAALAVLAPAQARGLAAEQRAQVGDYLLGQQTIADRLRTRASIAATPPVHAWAQAVAAELAPIAGDGLPDIPEPGAETAPPETPPEPGAATPAPAPAPARAPGAQLPSSRTGGAVLLVVLVAAVVVAVVLIGKGGGSHPHHPKTTAKTSTGPAITARIALRSPNPTSRSLGLVSILAEGSRRAFYLAAENMPSTKSFFYALWLYSGPGKAEPLGRAPAVGSNHRLEGGGALPANAANFRELLLTRETSNSPSHPGKVVLHGAFTLGSGS